MSLIGTIEQRAQHYERAVALFDELLSLDPTNMDAPALRANAAQQFELAEKYDNATCRLRGR